MRRNIRIGAVLIGLPLVAITYFARATLAQDSPFTNFSSTLSSSTATFSFAYSGNATYFYVDLSTVADMSWDVYGNFAEGSQSPIIQSDPEKWGQYMCGKTLYWRVRTASDPPSPIQSATVTCTTPTPTFTPSPTPTPIFCSGNTVWNGNVCKPFEMRGDTMIVGLDSPIASRAELDEIETNLMLRTFPTFDRALVYPKTQIDGKRIQDFRLAHTATIGQDMERTIEFLLNDTARREMEQNSNTIGTNAIDALKKQVDTLSAVWATGIPPIHRKATLKRVLVVSDTVASNANGGWQVVNDTTYSWWANDKLNGIAGEIPYDIDSRWTLEDDYARFLMGSDVRVDGILIDHSLLHELTHHLPVGDNYQYNMGAGHGISLVQPNEKTTTFTQQYVSFMPNDIMGNARAPAITSPSNYHITTFWAMNPKTVRTAQFSPYPVVDLYGHFFLPSITIYLTNLTQTGVTDCIYLRQQYAEGVPADTPLALTPSTDYTTLTYQNGTCSVTLDRNQQDRAFTGFYFGLVKGNAMYPAFVPRLLLEMRYWMHYPTLPVRDTVTLTATQALGSAVDYFALRLKSSSQSINMAPSVIGAYFDTTADETPETAVAMGPVDEKENRYVASFTAPACSAGDIDQNGNVDMKDLAILKADYLSPLATNPRSDITKDGVVDLTDYSWFVLNFGKTTAGPCL